MKFFGIIENEKLRLTKPDNYKEYIKKLKSGRVEIDIRKVRSIRSLNQNNLYWLWLGIIGDDTGYYPEELHATFRSMFLTDKRGKIPIVRSTTQLNKIQFGQYLDQIERLVATEFGIVLPQPEEYYEENWEKPRLTVAPKKRYN